jgi:hypothetical protein
MDLTQQIYLDVFIEKFSGFIGDGILYSDFARKDNGLGFFSRGYEFFFTNN